MKVLKDEQRIRRLSSPVDQDEVCREFASHSIVDLVEDLIGPEIKFHQAKLFDPYDGDTWVGCLSDADVARLPLAYTDIALGSRHAHELVRGEPARWARHALRPCQVGPVRARTIFGVQQREG